VSFQKIWMFGLKRQIFWHSSYIGLSSSFKLAARYFSAAAVKLSSTVEGPLDATDFSAILFEHFGLPLQH